MVDSVQLFNPNDGVLGRDGGPYLDMEQAKRDEDIRAVKENREPDYDTMPANAGIPLQTATEQLRNTNVNNLPSMEGAPAAATLMSAAVDNDEIPIKAWSEMPVITDDSEDEGEVGPLMADGSTFVSSPPDASADNEETSVDDSDSGSFTQSPEPETTDSETVTNSDSEYKTI